MEKTEITELNHYEVRIYKKPSKGIHDDIFLSETVDIVAENKRFLIVDDWYFTKVDKDKSSSSYSTCLGVDRISLRTDDSILGDGVFYELYTVEDKTPAQIKRKIKSYLDNKVGYLSNIDLSIIK